MAAPAFASYTVTVDNSLTLTTPTGAASGDLLIAIFTSDSNSDFDAGTNGFIAGGRLYSAIDCTVEWFYLPLNSAPASSYTFTRTGSGACRGWLIRVTGADLASPIDVSGFQEDTTSDTAHNLPTLTTTVADTLLIAATIVSSGAAYTSGEFTPPSGYTEISETGTVWNHTSTAWKTQAAAGATGSAAFTGVSAQSLQLLIAIKPASTGHTLSVQSATLTPSAPAGAISQTHTLAFQSATLSLSSPSTALAQTHGLAFQSGALNVQTTDIALSQGGSHSLSVQSGTLALSGPSLVLSQSHALALSSGTLGAQAPPLALSQTHALSAPPATLTPSAPALALSQAHALAFQGGTLALSGPSVALGQSHTLAVAAGVQGLQGMAVALQQSHSLALAPGSLTLSGSAIAIYGQPLQGSWFVASPLAPRYQATPEQLRYWASLEPPRYQAKE